MANNHSRMLWVLICVIFLVTAAMPVIGSSPQESDTEDDGFKGVDAKGVKEPNKGNSKKPDNPGGGKKVKVEITAPEDGDVVTNGVTVTVTTTISNIQKVEFYIDGVLETTDSNPDDGWSWDAWNTVYYDDGQREIMVKALDRSRVKGTSEIAVTVDNNADKWAVVIGIADYKGRQNDLQYTDDDAVDMKAYLRSRDYPSSNIKLLLNNAAKGNAIYDAIDWMGGNEGPKDECVFFYSGHGSYYDGYDDGDTEDRDESIICWELKHILDGFLRDAFSGYDSVKMAFIFDSCFSGGMNDLSGPDRVVVAACGETQYSFDGTESMENGVFTYYYMQGLYDPLTNNIVEEAFDYADDKAHDFVEENNNGYQMDPQMYDGDTTVNWQF